MSTPPPPDRFVLDGSVTLAWLFHDEKDPYADAIVGKLPALEMLVPRLWHLEVANVLLVGERRGRCTQADSIAWLAFLGGLPVDAATEARAWSDTIALGRQHGLTA
jgi:predicted nucleic acid-binding protein